MYKTCAASFCRKEGETNEKFYRFPHKRESIRLQVWQKRLLSTPTAKAPYQFACYRHFSQQQFCYNPAAQRMEIKRHAIPDKNIIRRTRDPEDPLDAVCRLCLERSQNNYQMIFPVWPDPNVPTAEDIAELFGIVITPDDALPRIVCVTCITKIKYMKRIRDQFRKNDIIMREKYLAQNNEILPPITLVRPAQKQASSIRDSDTEPSEVKTLNSRLTPPHRSRIAPKISTAPDSGDNQVECPSAAAGRNVFVKVEDVSGQLHIGEGTEQSNALIKIEYPNFSADHDEMVDTEINSVEDDYTEAESGELKFECNSPDVSPVRTDDDPQPEPPEKKLRGDKPFKDCGEVEKESSIKRK